jgi:hypothetical protein
MVVRPSSQDPIRRICHAVYGRTDMCGRRGIYEKAPCRPVSASIAGVSWTGHHGAKQWTNFFTISRVDPATERSAYVVGGARSKWLCRFAIPGSKMRTGGPVRTLHSAEYIKTLTKAGGCFETQLSPA